MTLERQEIIERADTLYHLRANLQNVRQSVKILQTIASANDYEAAWRLARAYFFLGQEARTRSEARGFHARGVAEGERAVKFAPQRVEGWLWRGVNLALLANLENPFNSARRAVRAKRTLQRAAQIDPAYHDAGPLRALARLLHKLPRLLGGNRRRAQILFDRAITLAPANSVTRLYFAQLLLAMGDKREARAQLEALLNSSLDSTWEFETTRDRRLAREMLRRMKANE